MKISTSRKLLFTSLAIVFLSTLLGLIGGVFTNNPKVAGWLESRGLGPRELLIGIVIFALALMILAYLQFRYDNDLERAAEKNLSDQNIEPGLKTFVNSLKERYQNRYDQKLDGRFEITLEVSEDLGTQNPRTFNENYEKSAKISSAFEYINGAFEKKGRLLIVGSPGIGKTVLLLKLSINLLEKRKLDGQPFPVILNLSSWSVQYENFEDWLIEMLHTKEGLSKEFAARLLENHRVIFFLDGLDELARNQEKTIAEEIRAACMRSLNTYLQRGQRLVICCREREFTEMYRNQGELIPVAARVK